MFQLPQIPLYLLPYILVAPIILIIIILVYIFFLKPRIELPLPDELYEGQWTIPLPGIGVLEGPVTTARKTIEKLWNEIIEVAPEDQREKLNKHKESLLQNYHFYAIRNAGQKTILIFNDNPLNDKYNIRRDISSRLGQTITTRFIHGIQACEDLGEEEGYKWIKITLKESNPTLTKQRDIIAESSKYLMRAAKNLERIKFLQDENQFLKEELEATQKELAKERSEKERAKRALAIKPLTAEETPEIKAGWKQIAKRFFSIPQIAACVIVYFLTPEILKRLGIILDQTSLSIAVGLATAATFFLYPPISNWIKRRL